MSQGMESCYAAVYWGCRVESAEECARRAETFFRLLSRCDPVYTRWFEKADSRKKALQLQFEPTAETFVRFFKRRSYKLAKVGFMFGAWTGHEGRARGGMVSITCGYDAQGTSNSCLLYLPREPAGTERVLTLPVLTEIMRAMVVAWEPDWGVISSSKFVDAISQEGNAGTFVGWMTYFSSQRGGVPPLPVPVRIEPLEDKGMLVILTPERAVSSNPEHVALGQRVQELLGRKGLLEPVIHWPPPRP